MTSVLEIWEICAICGFWLLTSGTLVLLPWHARAIVDFQGHATISQKAEVGLLFLASRTQFRVSNSEFRI